MTASEQQIQDYLEGKLGSRALAIFEERIATDPDFREQVEAARSQFLQNASQPDENQPIAQSFQENTPPSEKAPEQRLPKSNFNLYAMILVGSLVLGWMIYNRYFRPKGNFERAFSLPESIIDDLENRYANDPDTVQSLPVSCLEMLRSADELYLQKKFEAAQEPLVLLALDENPNCRSDAFFYLALVALQNKNPDLAMESFPKIEAYTRFGNDIQWYMTLAFVLMAEQDVQKTNHAVRALRRIEDSGQSDERKAIAKEILSKYE